MLIVRLLGVKVRLVRAGVLLEAYCELVVVINCFESLRAVGIDTYVVLVVLRVR